MIRLALLMLVALTILGCATQSASPIAYFSREWDDGRLETLELYADGRVLMDHAGYIDRTTLTSDDVEVLRAALTTIPAAADPASLPKLTLTVADGSPVVVDAEPGTVGALFLSLLERHRLP